DFHDFVRSIHPGAARTFGRGLESFATERLDARNHEDHVVRHQREHCGRVAGLGRLRPAFDNLPDRVFILSHPGTSSAHFASDVTAGWAWPQATPGARFINFNYTDTLQRLFGMPDTQVWHIHGAA